MDQHVLIDKYKNFFTLGNATRPMENEINWHQVYTESVSRIFHFFCYKVGDIQLAEDLTAATFEKAWKNRNKFKSSKGQPHMWIIGIARNLAADHFRRDHHEISFENLPESSHVKNENEEIEKRLEFQSILNLLSHYSQRERELIHLKYGAELNNRQIADMTGLSESNVGTILYRVVEKLGKEWETNHER